MAKFSRSQSLCNCLQIGALENKNRWLIINPHVLRSCVPVKLRVSVSQSDFNSTIYTFITLVPRKAHLVAVLETDAERVGYEGTVVLRADKSYDPDRIQVFVWTPV